MSKLLLDEQPLLVMPKLAAKIGLNESIILQQINYWNDINKKANNNYKDGHHWTFNSVKEWQEQFPFWSEKTIQRTITDLEKMKLIIVGNYNKLKIDRTKWYRINYIALEILKDSPFGQIGTTNMAKWLEHLDKMAPQLPEINTENTSEINKKHNGAEKVSALAVAFAEFKNNFTINEVDIEVIEYYISLYRDYRGKDHPKLKEDQWNYVVENMYYLEDFDLGETTIMDMMEQHFKTKYKNCDYNILHFMSNGVRVRRMYEVAY
jgi:hypothetical protein